MNAPPAFEQGSYKKKSPLGWILLALFGGCCVLCLPIGGAILFPVFSQAKSAAQIQLCSSHLRMLGLGQLIYAGDNDDHLPAADRWMDAIRLYEKPRPGLRSDSPYRCPAAPPGQYGYAMLAKLSQADTKKVANPASTPLIFDSTDLTWNAVADHPNAPVPSRHPPRNNYFCVDGSLKRERQAEDPFTKP